MICLLLLANIASRSRRAYVGAVLTLIANLLCVEDLVLQLGMQDRLKGMIRAMELGISEAWETRCA